MYTAMSATTSTHKHRLLTTAAHAQSIMEPTKKNPKKIRRRRKGHRGSDLESETLQRRAKLEVGIACGEKLLEVLRNLDGEISRLASVLDPTAWFPSFLPLKGSISTAVATRISTIAAASSIPSPETEHTKLSLSGGDHFAPALNKINQGVEKLKNFSNEIRLLPLPSTEIPQSASSLTLRPKRKTPKVSPYFVTDPFSQTPTPEGLPFELTPSSYGLIQERIRNSLFALVVQAILWNQTTAKAGRPVLFKLLCTYPTPEALAQAEPEDVLAIIRCLGLQKIRSERLVKLAQVWVASPPCPSRRYGIRNYPSSGDNHDTRTGELLDVDDIRPGWEVAHLPGIGAYALDSYRIFYRDTLRGIVEGDGNEPEWKRVLPLDKDLRPYLVWRWAREGWKWDPLTGNRERIRYD
jgi:endonuclease III